MIAAVVVFLFSCGAGNGQQSNVAHIDSPAATSPVFDATLAKGVVTDTVACRKEGSQTYALYLPSYYTATKPFPCIYFFDAHDRGCMPVSAYKDIAEKYGFVLIGSNVSQNGTPWEVTNAGVNILMADTRTRLNIDSKRIYTAGFSGGARVACSIALTDGGIAGVIGSAAGFPRADPPFQNKFDYFGIIGDFDFNFMEMEQLDVTLEQNGFTHQLLTSSGIHGWPSPAEFQSALLWMQVNAIKENLQPANDSMVQSFKKDLDKRIKDAATAREWINAHDLLSGAIRLFTGLIDVSAYNKQLAEIDNNAGYKSDMTARSALRQEELARQQELQKQFPVQNEKWWGEKIRALQQNIRSAKTPQEAQMHKRLLNYLGFICYMYSDHALKAGDAVSATKYLEIFKFADPHNPDWPYLSAVCYMLKGNKTEAMASLNVSTFMGFSEVAKLETDPAFSSLHGEPLFNSAVERAMENLKK